MPSRADITYFGAGPAGLPTDVLEKAAQALLDYNGTGLGIAEHSHRSEHATKVINEAKADLTSFLDIPAGYEILFMQGGGSGEFSAAVYNFVGAWVARQEAAVRAELGADAAAGASGDDLVAATLRKKIDAGGLKLDYVVTGSWSLKAYQEAQRLLGPEHVNLAADARKAPGAGGKFGTIPDPSTWTLSENPAVVYLCDNETVDGVEFPSFPEVLRKPTADGRPPLVVGDMSSNILSRPVAVADYAAVFFGAQKNLGTAGVTVSVVDKSLIPQPSPALVRRLGLPVPPAVLTYENIAKNNSLYNTLSIFDVYIAGQVLKKLLTTFPDKARGQQALAEKKAQLIYTALEAHPDAYKIVVADKSVRSRMNICFRVTKNDNVDESEKAFLKGATDLGLTGLKGHRSVGGIRASNYNSISLAGAEKLAAFIESFAKA